jgi:hypothetical protein
MSPACWYARSGTVISKREIDNLFHEIVPHLGRRLTPNPPLGLISFRFVLHRKNSCISQLIRKTGSTDVYC